MKKLNQVLFWIKNIVYFLFLFGVIKLLPNIYNAGFVGILFLIIAICYIVLSFYFYLKKDEKLNNDAAQNFISIGVYLYVYLIAMKFIEIKDFVTINNFYFITNYIIASVSMIGLVINNFLTLKKK